MKKFGLIALSIIAALILINVGPVWLQRIFGFYAKVEKVTYPQWINNNEYCYVKAVSYYDADLGWSTVLPGGFNPLLMFRGPNATFYIYKVDIDKQEEHKLLKKITAKVSFSIAEVYDKVNSSEFTFRRLDNGELVLLVRGRKEYPAYYLNTSGKLLKKHIFDYDFIGGKSISDISPDGKKVLVGDYIKDINSGEKVFFSDWKNKWYGPTRWLTTSDLIVYRIKRENRDKKVHDPKKFNYEIYFVDGKSKNIESVCSKDFLEYSEYDKQYKKLPSSEDAAFYRDQNMLFLSKIGIFKKEGEKWKEIKDLKDMEFNLYYPDWSPDGKRLVGVLDDKNIKVIEVEKLLRE